MLTAHSYTSLGQYRESNSRASYLLITDNQLLIHNRVNYGAASSPVIVNKADEIGWEYQVFNEKYRVTI